MAKRKTNEEFLREVKELVGEDYEFMDAYKGAKVGIRVRHSKCGNVYSVSPTNFLSGRRCPRCSAKEGGDKQRKTASEFIEQVKRVHGNEYKVLGMYKSWRDKLEVLHKKCGSVIKISPNHLLKGKGCRKCAFERLAHLYSKSHTTFLREVYEQVGEEYCVLSNYSNSKQKVVIRHNSCGLTYSVLPADFLRGRRCPGCAVSKGEDKVARCLDFMRIEYKPQVKFEDCVGDHSYLRFDFGVLSEDGILSFLIEYDGEQHYKVNDFFGGRMEFEKRKRYDEIKTAYCAERGIPLVRIPYWQYDEIEDILEKAIREYRAKPVGKPRERVETRWSSLTRKEWQNTHERRAP